MSCIARCRCRLSLASFFCSGGGASRVGVGVVLVVVVAAIVVVAAAVGGPAFGVGLGAIGGCALEALVVLGGGISLIVGSSDISDWDRLYLVYAINREKKTIDFIEIASKMSPTGY